MPAMFSLVNYSNDVANVHRFASLVGSVLSCPIVHVFVRSQTTEEATTESISTNRSILLTSLRKVPIQ